MSSSKAILFPFTSALAFALALGASPAVAGSSKKSGHYQYTSSFSCGSIDGAGSAVDGEYSTAIDLLNTGFSDATVRTSLALSRPPAALQSGAVSRSLDLVVAGGSAVQIDCEEMIEDFVFDVPLTVGEPIQGFLLIESDQPLEAEAVHSATSSGGGEVSIDVERLLERRVAERPVEAPSTTTICHIPPGNPGAAHTIRVGSSAVSAHRAHGDTLGPCSP